MSKEAWGDEGNVPSSTEDTAMYQELCKIVGSLHIWRDTYRDYIPNDAVAGAITEAIDKVDWLADCVRDN